jgi:hypothetical protein
MQTLGLQDESKGNDSRLKSIFWPTVENAWDVDYLGQQGFWFCVLIGASQIGFALLAHNLFMLVLSAFGASIYVLGGMGVREKSWPAAAIVFTLYLLDTLAIALTPAIFTPGAMIRFLLLGLLLSNLRATLIASRWTAASEDEDRPERFDSTWRDKLVDVWPPKVWKALRIPFFILSAFWLFLSLIGLAGVLAMKAGILPAHLAH